MTSAFDDTQKSTSLKGHSVSSRAKALEILLSSAIALGVFLRVAWAQKRELWYDEVLSVLLSSGQKNTYALPENVPVKVQEISQLLSAPADASLLTTAKDVIKGTLGDPHPPLFYLAQHGWMRLFGNGEGALRCLMVLVSVAALWVAYWVGKRSLTHRGGLIFTALLALNPFFLSHSLNLRMYTPLVLWVLIGTGCLLSLTEQSSGEHKSLSQRWLLRAGIAGSITAGLLTHYLFAYWLFALASLALYLDRKHWFQHALTMGAGVAFFMPWALWGTRQQIHNRRDVLNQISSVGGPLHSALQHSKDLAQTLANHLLLGHLTTSMAPLEEPIKPAAVAIGCGVIGLLSAGVAALYRRRQYRMLTIGLLMGVLPLTVALAIDTAANKYTLGFGWGRSVMVALPGCLLLIAAWLETATERWREAVVALVLTVYLGVNLADFGIGSVSGRDRLMFHTVSEHIANPSHTTLVALDTQAWGHVLRLAYYLSNQTEAELLATDPADMPDAIVSALDKKQYEQVLWLHANYPLWAKPESPEAAQALASQTQAALEARYPSGETNVEALSGTMNLDQFVLRDYRQTGRAGS